MKPILNKMVLFSLAFISLGLAQEIPYDAGERRDPFIPLITAEGAMRVVVAGGGGIEIEGIIYDPSVESLVLIEGDFYKIGDVVQQAQVVSIHKDKVVFDRDGEEIIRYIREDVFEEGSL